MKMISGIIVSAFIFAASASSGEADPKTDRVIIPFSFSRTGHILVAVTINDKKARFIVDTAAGASVIHTKQIESLGLKTSRGNEKVHGVGTSSHTMKNISVPIMTIGETQYRNPFFIAVDLSHVEGAGGKDGLQGLIGTTFLMKHAAIINYEKRTISLKYPEQKNSKANHPIEAIVTTPGD
jgi:hypothetical protein